MYLSGRSMKAPPHLFVGAVENPTAPPLEHRAERALKKVDAGARFLQLQIHYRPEQLEAFMAACVANGVAERAAILPTVCLTKTARALGFMNEHVPGISVPQATIDRVAGSEDPKEESYRLVRELAEHALSIPGVVPSCGRNHPGKSNAPAQGRIADERLKTGRNSASPAPM